MFLVAGGLVAGVPNRIIYQGRLFKSGVGVNGDKTIRLTLVKSDGKTVVDTKSFGVTLPATGEFTIIWDLDKEIDWRGEQPELKVEVDTDELTPRQQFSSTPYAFVAKRVEVGAVDSLSIADGAVTNEKLAFGIDASKINVGGTKTIKDWATPGGGIDAGVIVGTMTNTPNHAWTHRRGGTDELQLEGSQVEGAVISRSTFTQVIQAVSNSVPVLAVKGLPGSSSKILQIYDSGTVGDTASVPQEQVYFDKDANLVSNRAVSADSITASAGHVKGDLLVESKGYDGHLAVQGNQSAIAHKDATGKVRFLEGLRDDVSPSLNFVNYSYGGNWAFFGGNVGIGPVAPEARLHVASGQVSGSINGYTRLLVESDDNSIVSLKSPNNKICGLSFADSDNPNAGWINYTHTDNSMSLGVNQVERIRIAAGGNVGIGTDNPSEKLDVVGGSMRVTGNAILATGTNRVGIGTTSPSQKLDVSGNARINGDTEITGKIRGASFGFGGMYSISDVGSGNAFDNPLTGGKSCPAGFTAYPVVRVRTAEPEAGAHVYMCVK